MTHIHAWARPLHRRLATLDEVLEYALWRTDRPKPFIPGKFDHIPKRRPLTLTKQDIPRGSVTWFDVQQHILPHAVEISVHAETGSLPVAAFTTAVDPAAAPLLAWDTPYKRNPFDWFIPGMQQPLGEFGLAGPWLSLAGIVADPETWTGQTPLRPRAVFGILDDATPVERMDGWIRSSHGSALHQDFIKPEALAIWPPSVRTEVLETRAGALGRTPDSKPAAFGLHLAREDGAVFRAIRFVHKDGRVAEFNIVGWNLQPTAKE